MTTLMLAFAMIGAFIPAVVIIQALRSKAMDRWPEGVLVGVYLGTLGSISLLTLLAYFCG
jgi:hypothetical protein